MTDAPDAARRRFASSLVMRAPEPWSRELVVVRFPELLGSLPGPGASRLEAATALVDAARRHGCLDELIDALERRMRRRVRVRTWASIGALSVVALVAVVMSRGEVDAPVATAVAPEQPRTPEVEESVPVDETSPEVAKPERRGGAVRPRGRARVVAERSSVSPSLQAEAGAAACDGDVCRLTADAGAFASPEAVCVAFEGSALRCQIVGDLPTPRASVACSLGARAELRARVRGEFRWSRCP